VTVDQRLAGDAPHRRVTPVNRFVQGSSPCRGAKNNQVRKNALFKLTETPSHANGWAFSYPTVIKHLRRFRHLPAGSLPLYSDGVIFTLCHRIPICGTKTL